MNKKLVFVMFVSVLPLISARLIGNCYDSHGCATCGGYTWCEELQTCMRFWENPCQIYVNESEVELMDYMLGNNDI